MVKQIFLQPTDKEEVANIISSLNSNKGSGPNTLYTLWIIISSKNEFQSNWQIYLTSLS